MLRVRLTDASFEKNRFVTKTQRMAFERGDDQPAKSLAARSGNNGSRMMNSYTFRR